jgi:RNA polymerase sigma factor (sigma-70 family)
MHPIVLEQPIGQHTAQIRAEGTKPRVARQKSAGRANQRQGVGRVPVTIDADDITELVHAAQNGDRGATEQIVARYASLVWSVVRSFRMRDADAHDAVQNTWLSMIEHVGALREPDRLPGWLATTARRQCLKILQTGGREATGVRPSVFDCIDERSPDPERYAIDRAMNALLWEQVEQLSPTGRRMLTVLTSGDGPSYADFARANGMPTGSVGPTRKRYLRKLRRRMEESGWTHGPGGEINPV